MDNLTVDKSIKSFIKQELPWVVIRNVCTAVVAGLYGIFVSDNIYLLFYVNPISESRFLLLTGIGIVVIFVTSYLIYKNCSAGKNKKYQWILAVLAASITGAPVETFLSGVLMFGLMILFVLFGGLG